MGIIMRKKVLNNRKNLFITAMVWAGITVSMACPANVSAMSGLPLSSITTTGGAVQMSGWQEIEGKKYYFLPETGEMATGWQDIEGKKYYFSLESGELQAGWQEIEGKKYYFSLETGELQTGWQDIEGKKYYFLPETGEMATGWQDIGKKKYYFLAETGEAVTGWQEIKGIKYYFLPKTREMATGWQEIKGIKYYFLPKTGKMLTGRQKIGEKTYYFKKNGVLQVSGWAKSGEKTYYANKKGVLVSGWKKIKGKKYYFSPTNNQMFTGAQTVKGKCYIFDSKGRLAASGRVSLVTAGKQTYCAKADGTAASGWQVVGGKLYYAAKKGKVKKNTTYQGITLTKTGAAKKDLNAQLKMEIMEIFSSIIRKNMSRGQKLSACWSYVVGGHFHYASKYPNLNSAGWQRRTAYNMLSTHSGNCYSYACAFAALAAELGYHPYVVCGRVHGSRDGTADGFTRHAWVRINGLNYDPEAQYAGWHRGIYGRSGYPVAHQIQKVVSY